MMKKLTFAAIAILFLVASCGKKNNSEGTHTHEDGTTHEHHEKAADQEEFNASDTSEHRHDSTGHEHGHDH